MITDVKYVHTAQVHNLRSSNIVVPILIELFKPQSVLDVGCGLGTWLNSFYKHGVGDIIGIDGDFVARNQLREFIDEKNFLAIDLINPFDLNRSFDLVISLEVAEHLPKNSANSFVDSLCLHGDLIVFSAALPGQGGQNHLNEQWKDYWIQKFNTKGYGVYDIIRPIIWNNDQVDWWYKQNMIVFSKKEISYTPKNSQVLDLIHPDLFKQNLDYITYLQEYVRELECKTY